MGHALYHLLAWTWGGDGQGGASGDGYLITSGPVPAAAALGAFATWLYRTRCEEHRCLRWGRFTDRKGKRVCARHLQATLPVEINDVIRELRDH